MSTPNAHLTFLTESELDLQMQALVQLKEAKAEEKHLCAEEAAKLAAEEAKKAKAAVREARRAKKQKAAEPGPKAKKAKMDETTGPEGSLANIPYQQ